MSEIAAVDDGSFDKEVLQAENLVLVDFWAEWCGPCRMLAPILNEVAMSLKQNVKIVKMNVDESPEVPTRFGIRSIPTMILFKKGEPISTKVGPMPRNKLEEWIRSNV